MVDVSAQAGHGARGGGPRPHPHRARGHAARARGQAAARAASSRWRGWPASWPPSARRTRSRSAIRSPLTHVDVIVAARRDGFEIEARVRTDARTGAEMEALHAVAVAALTVYDMVKAADKGMTISRHPAGAQDGRHAAATYVRRRSALTARTDLLRRRRPGSLARAARRRIRAAATPVRAQRRLGVLAPPALQVGVHEPQQQRVRSRAVRVLLRAPSRTMAAASLSLPMRSRLSPRASAT